MSRKISDKDKKDWEKFVNSKETLEDKDEILKKKQNLYLEKTIDLHGYTLEEANIEAERFILECFSANFFFIFSVFLIICGII